MKKNNEDSVAESYRLSQARIASELAKAGFALPGSVVVRRTCGKSTCACHADPPRLHKPIVQWTRKINQKTVTRTLTDEQWQYYKKWFDNAKRLRELLSDLEALSMEIFQADL